MFPDLVLMALAHRPPSGSRMTVRDHEMEKLKELYLDKTEHIDKMQGHGDSLLKAVAKDRIPNKRIRSSMYLCNQQCIKMHI